MTNNPIAIQQHASLKSFNTFGIDVQANGLVIINNQDDLLAVLNDISVKKLPKLLLGEGSNILFTENFSGLVIKNNIKGIHLLKEDDDFVWVEAGAGENWHQFVLYCLQHNYGGVENLSLIPGTVGAAPIQNIGAYGVELKDIFCELTAINLQNGTVHKFTHAECQFGYRDSIFKKTLKQQFAITSVCLRLHKKPQLNTAYSSLHTMLKTMPECDITIKTISDAVIQIRREKLPDPKQIGNAGSFFKNPIVTKEQFSAILKRYQTVPHFLQENGTIKINAAWLIEQCGFKGKREGDVGVYPKQALVLVNYGNGKGKEVLALAKQIEASVTDEFGIILEPEVLLL